MLAAVAGEVAVGLVDHFDARSHPAGNEDWELERLEAFDADSVGPRMAGKPRGEAKPSDGLEPSTPSLPFWGQGNWSQPMATVFARMSRFRPLLICH